MTELRAARQVVADQYAAIGSGKGIGHYVAPDYRWNGVHPFHTLIGAASVESGFWRPLQRAFAALQRRPDIFFAASDGDETVVVQMGHLLGLHDAPWLGLRPTRKMTFLPYADFHTVADGVITKTTSHFDILSVMQQAGLNPLPRQTGAQIIAPGPLTHDGLADHTEDTAERDRTLTLIDAAARADPLEQVWSPDLSWFGPAGIGATSGITGYRHDHSTPFENGLNVVTRHAPHYRIAAGCYGGLSGYPLIAATSRGFLGLTNSATASELRIATVYRREGARLAECWCFMDLLHFLNMQGYDALARAREMG